MQHIVLVNRTFTPKFTTFQTDINMTPMKGEDEGQLLIGVLVLKIRIFKNTDEIHQYA